MLGNRYRVVDRIGTGGMADVFRAHDEMLARDVAVKVFRTHAVEADTASGAERQQIELHALARLNHPNLITLFDGSLSSADGGPTFLVMELINGPTLAARIAEGPLSEPEVREVGIQIADALAYVHTEGMVHRDVKPANILLGTDRTAGDMTVRARLSDFGIVRLLGSERMTNVDFTVGTASYLAPEQARGSDVGPVADVYSLGLVLLESHTGVRAYDGTPVEAVLARLERGPDIPDHLPPPWPSLLAAMTATDPDQRPNAEQVAQTLRDVGTRTAPFPLAAAAGAGMGATAATSTASPTGATGAVGPAVAAGAAALAAPALAAAAAGAAGSAGATGAAALADAPTVGLAAVGGSGAASPPDVDDPWAPADEPRRGRGALWLLAAVLVAALAVGSFLLFKPTSKDNPPADVQPGGTNKTSHSAAKTSPGTSSFSSTSSSPTSTATTSHSNPVTTSAAPSTTAAPSSSVPASSATPSTTPSPSIPATSTAAGSTAVAAPPPTTSPPVPGP